MVSAVLAVEDGRDDAAQVGERELSIDDDLAPDLGHRADQGEAKTDDVAKGW
jgi:hypothetical protein